MADQTEWLNAAEKSTLENALRHAAGIYRADAEALTTPFEARLREQFERQAREADALADRIECGNAVGLL